MTKTLPIYLVAGFIGIIAFYCGLSGKKLLFIRDAKSAVVTLAIVGFIMCSTGAIGNFVTKAPVHPLSILGYLLGIAALLIALAQVFGWRLPFVENPKNSLIMIGGIVVIKVIIARFHYILK